MASSLTDAVNAITIKTFSGEGVDSRRDYKQFRQAAVAGAAMKGGDHHVEIFNDESVTAKTDLKAASNSFVFYYLTTLLRGGALQML